MGGFHRGTLWGLWGRAGKVSTFHYRPNVKENAGPVKARRTEVTKERSVAGKTAQQDDGIADYRGDC